MKARTAQATAAAAIVTLTAADATGYRPTQNTTHRSPMSPARKNPHRPPVHAKYLAELRGRVDALGFRVVAKNARMGLATLWRTVGADANHPPTLDAVERVRATVMRLDAAGAEIPPPIVSVEGAAHAAWCAIGAELAKANPSSLAVAVASPRALRAAIVAVAKPAARRRRRT